MRNNNGDDKGCPKQSYPKEIQKSKEPIQDSPRQIKISQSIIPNIGLRQALRVPHAIADSYAYKPATPAQVARALDLTHTDRTFRRLSGAAIAYGLVTGGAQSNQIALTPLGTRIVKPTAEGDDAIAMREAFLKPRIVRQFLEHYDGATLPRENIARNVLVDMDVPVDRTAFVHKLIVDGAKEVGLAAERDGKIYVDLQGTAIDESKSGGEADDEIDNADDAAQSQSELSQNDSPTKPIQPESKIQHTATANISGDQKGLSRRVFITHGHNKAFIDPIRRLLKFGELEAIVAAERQSVSQPLPDKVMNDMRSCGSAIIHVDVENTLLDKEAKEHVVLNPNVLIEIGAAMALYGRRFILLVREGVKLPSNLQGLYDVRYASETLDGDTTIRLLEAINDIKNHPLPARYVDEAVPAKESD